MNGATDLNLKGELIHVKVHLKVRRVVYAFVVYGIFVVYAFINARYYSELLIVRDFTSQGFCKGYNHPNVVNLGVQ